MVSRARLKRAVKPFIPMSLWTRLRLHKLKTTLQSFPAREVRHTYGGQSLRVWLADPMAEDWYDKDWTEPGEISILRDHQLKPNATVFDLGAHQCVVAMLLCRAVGPEGRVVALEANPHNAEVARRNRELNHMAQLTILQAAVAAKSGTLTFNQGLNGNVVAGSGDWGRVEVEAISIDDLTQRYGEPDVLFIDVEGYECRALEGANRTLQSHPDCFVEVHVGPKIEEYGGSAEQVLAYFAPEHYDLYVGPELATLPKMTPIGRAPEGLLKSKFVLVAVSKNKASVVGPDTPAGS